MAASLVDEAPTSPAPLLVVLDGHLLGMMAIETARLLTAAGEIEPIVIAAVSADGHFGKRRARRGPDFSTRVSNLREQASIQGLIPQIDASGIPLEEVFGSSHNSGDTQPCHVFQSLPRYCSPL